MRLQKYLADSGACSRREAEERIIAGRVSVNGRTARIGESVTDGDVVCLDGTPVRPKTERTYIMLHKPRGYVTTLKDEKGRPTVAELVADAGVRVYPVGRLDYQSEGLLILTDDGETANRLAHPSHGVEKTYRVWVKGEDPANASDALRSETVFHGVRYRPARVSVVRSGEKKAVLDVTVSEGKNREVRNMCAAAGLSVERLVRIRQGELRLGRLGAGQWRYLTAEERAYLQKLR